MNRPLHTLDRSYAGLRRGLVAALVVGYAVSLAACGGSGSKSDTSEPTAPTITTQPQNQTVTVGATAMFTVAATGTAPLSYQWSKNGTAISGATSSSYTTPATVSGDNGASFTVTVSNSAGNQTSSAATLTVNPAATAPMITTQPQNQSVTVGSTATFSVAATGTAPLTYQWFLGGTAIAGATNSSYTTPATKSGDSGDSFTVTVSNAAGSQTSNAATLTVTATAVAPTITTQPQSQTVTVGSAATFSVVATGTAPLSYQWSKNGTAISGAISSSYTTPATVSGDNGASFTVKVTNAAGSKTSNAATLTVNVPPMITTQPQNQTVTLGATATFSVVASGTAPLSYQWSKNGTAISGATSASYTTPATVSGDNGATFTVKVSNVAGSQTSTTATLTVNASGVSVTVSPRRAAVTTGVGQTFTATVTGSANTSVTWSVDGVAGGSSTVGTISASGVYSPPSTAGTHTVTATSVANTSASASSSVAVTDLTGVVTQRYDNARDGQNLQEYALNSAVLSTSGAFGKVFSCAISDGPVYSQPLYAANLAISGGTHNVVFVATQQNTVYAFDADASPCTTYWKVSLDPSGSTPTPNNGNQSDSDINGPYGIFGTPVIDLAGGVLYAVASTLDGGSTFNYRLHALNLATGAEKSSSPVVIGATASGVKFDPSVHMQRPGLLLSGSTVYVSFGSYGDANTYYGWIMGYDKTTLTQTGAFNTAPNSTQGAIWMAGAGPAADGSGNIYISTANGGFDGTTLPPPASNDDFGDTLLKLTSSLSVADYFTPADQSSLDSGDLDFGSAGVALLPDAAGSTAHLHLAIASDKESKLYLVDRDNMGKYNGMMTNTNVQTVTVNNTGGGITTGFFTTASYWNGNVYAGAVTDNVKVYPISNAVLASSPA
ncbi:MAG TPA: immunoglobulin domain-containing protein, partial [Candidatus Margulisiibacteriota bacterium]|nr:immunoglobulin domain-containing protein [Candidatus Margulisiibacteriota bacterium]